MLKILLAVVTMSFLADQANAVIIFPYYSPPIFIDVSPIPLTNNYALERLEVKQEKLYRLMMKHEKMYRLKAKQEKLYRLQARQNRDKANRHKQNRKLFPDLLLQYQ